MVGLLAAGTLSLSRGRDLWSDTNATAGPRASTGLRATSPVTGVGPLPDGGAASCVESYSPDAASGRSFAFDGTVTAIGPARTNRPGVALDLAGVTFRVHQWFRGGAGDSVTVDIAASGAARSGDEASPSYGLGTRLLVSREPKWDGAPLDNAIAWGCGFTRYYTSSEASQWAKASS